MKKALRWILFSICLAVFVYSAYQLISIYSEYRRAKNYYSSTASEYVKPAEAAETQSETPQTEKEAEPADTEAAAQPNEVPITVDFESLRAENSDVIGWLYCADTAINYPVVQGDDNSYYLNRMMDGSSSSGGTIFMDDQGSPDFSDNDSVLYGHNMKDGSMFHSLLSYSKQEYYDEHPTMYLLTPTGDYRVDLFSAFVTAADSWAYVLRFGTEAEHAAYLEKAISSSAFVSGVTPAVEDKLLLLSTCSYEYDDARYVVLGVLTPLM
ncbi:MAG: class B sortase [Oscillospiraceae bacterium]|nr:class B sortase [Oscillospiraceae bacterium]